MPRSAAAVDDGDRGARSLRRSEWHVVAAVRERRAAEVCADHDHLLPELNVRGLGVRPDAGGGRHVREHLGERKSRFVIALLRTVRIGPPSE